jgi:hypothetical protein
MATSNDVAEYIIEVYTKYGVEIQSIGDDSIIINLPAAFSDMTEFCTALYEEFGSIVDIEYDNSSMKAVVSVTHLQRTKEIHPTLQQPSRLKQPPSQCKYICVLLIPIMCAVVYIQYVILNQDTSFRDNIATMLMSIAKSI